MKEVKVEKLWENIDILSIIKCFQVVANRHRRKANLKSNRFMIQKKFYKKFIKENFNSSVYVFDCANFFPDGNKNYIVGNRGFLLDFFVLVDEMNMNENVWDKIKIYIKFKHFFLIKLKNDEVYFFNNYIFEREIENMELSEEVKKILKNEDFKNFYKMFNDDDYIKDYMVKLKKNRFDLQQYQIFIYFEKIKFREELNNRIIQSYKCIFDFFKGESKYLKKKGTLDILIFEDVILINDIYNKRLYIYNNIFNIEIIKNKEIFFEKLKEYVELNERLSIDWTLGE